MRSDSVNVSCWEQHDDAIWKFVKAILLKNEVVRIWFTLTSAESYFEKTLMPFLYVYQERLPLRHQYFTNEALDLRLDRLSIKDIDDKMYCNVIESSDDKRENKSSELMNFHTLSYNEEWVTNDDFNAYAEEHVVREYQYQKTQTVYWQFRDCQVFLMRLPTTFTIDSERVTMTVNQYDPKVREIKNSYVAFIRSSVKKTPPAENTRVEVQFDAIDDDRANNWRDVIIRRGVEELKLIDTDFAVLIQKPTRNDRYIQTADKVEFRDNLQRVRVKILQSDQVAQRELDDLETLVASSRERCQRVLTLLSKRISSSKNYIDVIDEFTNDSLKKIDFLKIFDVLKKARKLNKKQIEALLDLQAIPDYVQVILDSSNTVKTINLRDSVWLMIEVDHRVTIFAFTNATLNNVINVIYATNRANQLKNKKILRLKIEAAKELAMLRSTDLDQARDRDEEINLQDSSKWTQNDELYLKDPTYLFTLKKMKIVEFENELLLLQFMNEKKDLKTTYALI